ncbi:MAG: hypothetical protein H0X24_19960 [Ktedonobacterales bacterium]|nr:hypothetical protein [Ktedonobacterales bacterium]
MKSLIIGGALALSVFLGGCGIHPHNTVKTPTDAGHPLVNLSSSIFLGSQTVTIKTGQTISFKEPTTGGMHVLLAGLHGAPQPQTGAPTALNAPNGIAVYAGQIHTVTFTQPGTYHITALYHDAMQLTVIVK